MRQLSDIISYHGDPETITLVQNTVWTPYPRGTTNNWVTSYIDEVQGKILKICHNGIYRSKEDSREKKFYDNLRARLGVTIPEAQFF
jgi:hypothetical protein